MPSETPWTPGPWVAEESWVENPDTGKIEDGWSVFADRDEDDWPTIAAPMVPPHQANPEADCRLIAAAPEMAELLERLVGDTGVGTGWQHLDFFVDRRNEARFLLARINGAEVAVEGA